jgi:hypothetical protein
MIDYSKFPKTSAIPEASSMIESFRAIGYNIETAIADIIDNSISANSKNIWINFEWLGSKSYLVIKDDGCGMDDIEIIQAMRPGSKNPTDRRGANELGRFGLGLKTASFSQARKLTLISKKQSVEPVYWTWDLDFVRQTGSWDLIKYVPDKKYLDDISKMNSGTIVIWNDIDRVVKNSSVDDKTALDRFLIIMENVKKHISMVFHKFIQKGKVHIFFQDHEVEYWDPFLLDETATQIFPQEKIQNGLVKIEGFVLPHKNKITEVKYKYAEGIKGWNDQQGFYIYRNDRLLLAGDWLGLFRKEEHYKLTRIQIELPNTLDSEWQIDIKKSIARPPLVFRDQIKSYANNVRKQALEVYRHKGKSIRINPGQKFVPLWVEHKRGDKWFYKINRENPIIVNIKNQAKLDPEISIEKLLKFIEETIPSKSIYIKESEHPELQGAPFEATNQDAIKDMMKIMLDNFIENGLSLDQSKAIIMNIEPFNLYPEILEAFE